LPELVIDRPAAVSYVPGATELGQTLRLAAPLAAVWSAIQDPRLVAECVPGARLVELAGDQLRGEVRASLGPIETLFTGEGQIRYDASNRQAEVIGEGRDSRTGTRLNGRAVVRLHEIDAATTGAVVTIDYTMQGPLAQFARGSIVQDFAAEISAAFAANLQARLAGGTAPQQTRLSTGWLLIRAILRRLGLMRRSG
jgi:carbon-monoxide dehydrogenase small subunit